jgi:hypothetical protein
MANLTDKMENVLIDWLLRAQAMTSINGATAAAATGPANTYMALYRATAGISPRSTAVTVGQTTVPATSNGRMYRCTTAGTTGAGEPTWGTVNNGTTTDGTAVWTEMNSDFEGNTTNLTSVEVTGGSYARLTIVSALANWTATQGGTGVSTGSSGATANVNILTFSPTPTAGWGVVAAAGLCDASTTGNLLMYGVMAVPKTINSGDTVTYPVGNISFQIDN